MNNIVKSNKEIKFFYLPYKPGWYFSLKQQKPFYATDIKSIVWADKDTPVKGELLTLKEIIAKLPDLSGMDKSEAKKKRHAIMRFETDEFPLSERVGYDKWNGIIFIDLDLNKCSAFENTNDEYKQRFYDIFSEKLMERYEDNFYFIEHSSSHTGIHIMFYYDIKRTQENYLKCAEYTKHILMTGFDDVIGKFSKILSQNGVFDEIYKRPYQKCFITGIDAIFNDNCNGNINVELQNFKVDYINKKEITSHVNLVGVNIPNKMFDGVGYDLRLKIATALKRITANKDEWYSYWCELNKHLINDKYDYKYRCNEFNYDKLDENRIHPSILKQFGFDIEEGVFYHHLGHGNYLEDIIDEVIDECEIGINFLKAPTGSGKTQCWINYFKSKAAEDVLGMNNFNMLIIEPYNSIIDTKYDKEANIINKSKQFPNVFLGSGLYVTNYNKLLRKTIDDRYELREDIDNLFSNFDLIVIDESHIVIKDSFRCEVLIPFAETINKAAKTKKIILQTATEMDEDSIFDIKTKIIVSKPTDKRIKYIFRRFIDVDENGNYKHFNIQEINCLCNYYVDAGRKVYVYWNNASLNKLESFKKTYFEPDKVAIYHKRNTGEESMEFISEEQKLGDDYDILLSSVYFGVGNDLNDECNTAVIIIGNNTWQEDLQAIGRWRNSKDIEVCVVLLSNDYDYLKYTQENEVNRNVEMVNKRAELERRFNDKKCRDKSIIIRNKSFQITKREDIEPLAIMLSSDDYYSSYKEKISMLTNDYYNIDVRVDIEKELLCNDEYNDKLKIYNDGVKTIRDEFKRKVIGGYKPTQEDYEQEVYKDTNIERWVRIWNRCKSIGLDKLLPAKYFEKNNHMEILNCFIQYYRKLKSREIDYSELYALLWYRSKVLKMTKEEKNKQIVFNEIEIKNEDYYKLLGYIIWYRNRNLDAVDFRMQWSYFKEFKNTCIKFQDMPEEVINMFFNTVSLKEINMKPTLEFFGVDKFEDKAFEEAIIHNMDDILAQRITINGVNLEHIRKIIIGWFNMYDGKVTGQIGGSKTKKIKMLKDMPKYNLKEGDIFESCIELAKLTGKSKGAISKWIKTGKCIEID